jgi:GT2 family glycosyltransferase
MSKICVSILSFNGSDHLEKCLTSFVGQKLNNHSFEIHILDNNSKDNSVEIIEKVQKDHPELNIKLSLSKENRGFTGGNNLILEKVLDEFDYFILFNQDAYITDPEFLQKYVQASQSVDDQALIQATIKTFGGELTGAGIYLSYYGVATPTNLLYNQAKTDLFKIPITQFACVIIPTSILKRIGLLEDLYFAYHEDVEYSLRASLHGYQNLCAKSLEVFHNQKPGRFRQKKFNAYLCERNRYFFILTHYSWWLILMISPILILQDIAFLLLFIVSDNLDGKIRGYREVLSSWSKIMAVRKKTRLEIIQSRYKKHYYASFRRVIDATKIYKDKELPLVLKVATFGLNLLCQVYYPIFKLCTRLFP